MKLENVLKYITVTILISALFCINVFANEVYTVSDYVDTPNWVSYDLPTAVDSSSLSLGGKSAILMEESTGKILYEYNADEKMPPASITKIMTLLLTMEALERGQFSLESIITCSEHAASMGGAQIWLETGEKMSVDDVLKAVCIKSANDAAVALAELVSGSEEGFVMLMNERAKELGMTNTTFKNASGLDSDGHLSTARDIAIMSRALMRHDKIFEYTKIWMDTLRGGQTELVNTNKLIRFYKGATGLKTGTTDGAGSCLSATAERDGMSLIGVVMGYPDSKTRNAAAKKLLDFGFANYKIAVPEIKTEIPKEIKVTGGMQSAVEIESDKIPSVLIERNNNGELASKVEIEEKLSAPVKKGQVVGNVKITLNGEVLTEYQIKTKAEVKKMTFFSALKLVLLKILF